MNGQDKSLRYLECYLCQRSFATADELWRHLSHDSHLRPGFGG